ncbi:MAG TPA: hypothetical protein VF297_19630 [Pyrinomonadaceae bacterium]
MAYALAGVDKPFIFWSSSLSPASEFVAEDPLALDYVAQQIGLWLLPGLTTRTSRAGYYPMVLYGLTLAEEAVDRFGLPKRDAFIQELFERWERFWAIAVGRLHRGRIPSEDGDAMRGINGAKRAARSSPGERVPIDYKLIERQTELAALGAYLSSLRFYELVQEGTLVPTKLGRDLASLFWGDGGHPLQGSFREYALKAMEPSRKTLPARHGTFMIERVGELSRLGVIRKRPKLQQTLWQAFFAAPSRKASPDHTPELAGLLISTSQEGVTSPKEIMVGATRGRWGETIGADLRRLLKLAVVFENFAAWARATFDGVYRRVHDACYILSRERLTAEALPAEICARGARLAARLIEHPSAAKLAGLPAHGAGLLRLASACVSASPEMILESLLAFHQRVQTDRRHTGGWLRAEEDKIVADLTGYTAARASAVGWTHDFKLGALRSLLRDLGRVR